MKHVKYSLLSSLFWIRSNGHKYHETVIIQNIPVINAAPTQISNY